MITFGENGTQIGQIERIKLIYFSNIRVYSCH